MFKSTFKINENLQSASIQTIDLNAQYRVKSKSDSEKNFFKLINNSVHGKSIEHVHKWKDLKIVTGSGKIMDVD